MKDARRIQIGVAENRTPSSVFVSEGAKSVPPLHDVELARPHASSRPVASRARRRARAAKAPPDTAARPPAASAAARRSAPTAACVQTPVAFAGGRRRRATTRTGARGAASSPSGSSSTCQPVSASSSDSAAKPDTDASQRSRSFLEHLERHAPPRAPRRVHEAQLRRERRGSSRSSGLSASGRTLTNASTPCLSRARRTQRRSSCCASRRRDRRARARAALPCRRSNRLAALPNDDSTRSMFSMRPSTSKRAAVLQKPSSRMRVRGCLRSVHARRPARARAATRASAQRAQLGHLAARVEHDRLDDGPPSAGADSIAGAATPGASADSGASGSTNCTSTRSPSERTNRNWSPAGTFVLHDRRRERREHVPLDRALERRAPRSA